MTGKRDTADSLNPGAPARSEVMAVRFIKVYGVILEFCETHGPRVL